MKIRWRRAQQVHEEHRRPLVELNLLEDQKRKTNPPGRTRGGLPPFPGRPGPRNKRPT
jgi:hypothetical protein